MVATAANYEITITLLYHTVWDDDADIIIYTASIVTGVY